MRNDRRPIMRSLNFSTFGTLDGVVQDPTGFGEADAGGGSRQYFNGEGLEVAYDYLKSSDVFLLGRKTYELFKKFGSQGHESEYAARINSIPKLVASTTLRGPLEWNARVIDGDVAEEIAKLKQEPGDNILVYGSPTLMRTIAKYNLVDEYKIWVHPVVLGSGKRLFAEGFDKTNLKLIDAKRLSSGVVILTYRPA